MKPWMLITTLTFALLLTLTPAWSQNGNKMTKEERKAMMQQADSNKDGNISFDELKAVRPKLTQEKFNKMDTNGDGMLNKSDRKKPEGAAKPAQKPAGKPAHPPIGQRLAQADTDKDGKVTWEEAKAAMPKMTEEAFKKLDTNGDGVITKEDKPKGAGKPNPQEQQRRREEFAKRLKAADTDNDGKITREETKAAMPKMTDEAFKKLDHNGDGVITKEDRKPEGAGAPDAAAQQQRRQEFAKRLQAADVDKDGKITREETKTAMPKMTDESFKKLDRNGDGVITKEDRKPKQQ